MDYFQKSLELHEAHHGKIEVNSKVALNNFDDLSLAYTPGVAQPCREIHENPDDVYRYTSKGNMVAVVSDGSAVLGLGNIGAKAAIPVMEGKCVLFKQFGGVDAFPICLDTQDEGEIIDTVARIAPVFGGINLEDISAPRCFAIERALDDMLDIPVFHDDQHGTAIVASAAILNAAKLVEKRMQNLSVVISGAGAAGTAIAGMLKTLGVQKIVICDSRGIIGKSRSDLNASKREIAETTNPENLSGTLSDALRGSDVFIGVSAPGIVSSEMVKSMNRAAIVLPMANPTPEIMPEAALAAGAAVVGTGRSDFPNQINNVLAFPGIFRGALDARAHRISGAMKAAAASALSELVSENELKADYILPKAFDPRVASAVAKAVYAAAIV